MDIFKALVQFAGMVDDLPVSPRNLGTLAVHWHVDRSKERAATDPRWASIEARRQNPKGTITFLSDDLTWQDKALQDQIEEELTPDPLWLGMAFTLKELSVAGKLFELRDMVQRGRRGWADSDVHNLHSTHLQVLGEMLLHLSSMAHGWPGSEEFPTYEDWVAALAYHGKVLAKAGWINESADESLEAWAAVHGDPDATDEELEECRAVHDDDEAAASERVNASLQWVVDHHGMLWD